LYSSYSNNVMMGTENCSIVKCHGQENNFKYLNIYIYLERIISRLKTILKIRLS